MIADYNHAAAVSFVEALLAGNREAAYTLANQVTADPDAVNYGAPLEKEYNDAELAELISANLKGIDQGRWDMTNKVYLPVVIGAVLYWLTKEPGDDDGKISSESFEQSQEHDVSGT